MAEKKLVIASKKYRGESSVVSVRLPNELIRHLDTIAEETGRTRNELIQTCLEFALGNLEIDNS
ncbi:MAG: ribbon-helix-helix protein, CopG family [Clostridia bacterium]|nr:ribbon-helix-helix protein, CopG family [Clostridia bacterium]MDY6184411.1 ribbon-helix-helix protein, CopG family [Eubacteriales bacterium]